MSTFGYRLFYQRNLPHYQPPEATLFVTFRLAGSLPHVFIRELGAEKKRKEKELAKIADVQLRKHARETAQKKLFGRWDAELDGNLNGPTWLAEPGVASLVCDAMHYRDGREFTLEAYCVMPNHVHLVCTPLTTEAGPLSLTEILHSLKGYTARKANLRLKRQGTFWQHESYDHVVRDPDELRRIVNYVVENPGRAGLPDRWIYCRNPV